MSLTGSLSPEAKKQPSPAQIINSYLTRYGIEGPRPKESKSIDDKKGEMKDAEKSETKDYLVEVELKEDDPKEFRYFANGNKVTISNDPIKLKQLLSALHECKWDDKIFNDPHLPCLIISLYFKRLIVAPTCFGLYERWQSSLEFQLLRVEPFLKNGQLTAKAKKVLKLAHRKYFKKITGDAEKLFCQLLEQFPPCDQVYSVYKNDSRGKSLHNFFINDFGRQFGALIYSSLTGKIIRFSAAAREVLGIVRFGLQHRTLCWPQLGTHKPQDIIKANGEGFRPADLLLPTIPIDKIPAPKVHGAVCTRTESNVHDEFHCGVDSRTPLNIRKALFTEYSTAINRYTLIELSAENWYLNDGNNTFMKSYFKDLDQLQLSVQQCTRLVFTIMHEYYQPFRRRTIFLNVKGFLTTALACLIQSFYENPDAWLDLKIDLQYTPSPFRYYYQNSIKALAVRNIPSGSIIFQLQVYFALKSIKKEEHFAFFSDLLKEYQAVLPISYGKAKLTDVPHAPTSVTRNSIYTIVSIKKARRKFFTNDHIITFLKELLLALNLQDFRSSIFVFKFNENETMRYIAARKQNISEPEARYHARHSVANRLRFLKSRHVRSSQKRVFSKDSFHQPLPSLAVRPGTEDEVIFRKVVPLATAKVAPSPQFTL